ncbi:GNAT family N-acetyltransferase [Lachnospiraceae bacterium 54-11]
MELKIVKYSPEYEQKWDEFIQKLAVNGTFLQERRFLNYHACGRFEDSSIIFIENGKIVALCPACIIYAEGKKVFYSHMGSTYGGIILDRQMLRADRIQNLLEVFENFLQDEGFEKCVLKQTMDILCEFSQALLEFFLYFRHYREFKELNLYIDYSKYNGDILKNFSKMKKRNVRKCISAGFELRLIEAEGQIKEFHRILSVNLMKYNKKPVHSVEELLDLKGRLNSEIEFYGAYLNGILMAGTMVFIYEKTKCAHTQYLASDLIYNDLNPMAYIYYSMVKLFYERKFKYLSWGIATEHAGIEVNYSLANNKEEYGSLHTINRIFEKSF